MADYSRHSSEELTNLLTRKILRYAELLRMVGGKTINANEQEEYLLIKSELIELDSLIQLKNAKLCQK